MIAGAVNTNKKLAPRLLWPGGFNEPSAAASDPAGGLRYWCFLTAASVRNFAVRTDLYCDNSLSPVSFPGVIDAS